MGLKNNAIYNMHDNIYNFYLILLLIQNHEFLPTNQYYFLLQTFHDLDEEKQMRCFPWFPQSLHLQMS